jgi:hypothetical protein
MPLPLVERALCTAAFIRRLRASDPYHPDRAEQHLRARLRLAAVLGLPYQRVTIPHSPLGQIGRHSVTLTAADPADPRTCLRFYLHDSAVADGTFYAMGPCPSCTADVPLVQVVLLADLAPLLNPRRTARSVPLVLRDPVFTAHPAHPRTCPFRSLARTR